MAPVYKLKYFNCMGLVEPVRYLLAYGNMQYENVIVSNADWVKMKMSVPFCKLPIFEVDGKQLFHCAAICKYIGKLVGLMPSNDFEVAEMDAICDVVYELGNQVWCWEQKGNKNAVEKELVEVTIPKCMSDLEGILTKKGTFFGGQKMCWADCFVIGMCEYFELALNQHNWFSKYPCLQQLCMEVKNCPSIKAYITKRPSYSC